MRNQQLVKFNDMREFNNIDNVVHYEKLQQNIDENYDLNFDVNLA